MANLWTQLLINLKREKLLAVTNIVVMTVTFLMLGFFISLIFVSQSAIKYLENQAQITVFFSDDFPETNILGLQAELQDDPRISKVTYISKEEAFRIFKEINKNEPILLESISANILPASLEIRTKNLANLSILSEELSKKDGIEDVTFFRDVIERFRFVRNIIYVVGFGLVVFFLLISYSVVIATLRTTINSKSTELEIQKLVGASNSYVKSPLIFQGVFFGLVSSAISALLLFLIASLIRAAGIFEQGLLLPLFSNARISVILLAILLGFLMIISGGFLGYFGSWTAVKKHLEY